MQGAHVASIPRRVRMVVSKTAGSVFETPPAGGLASLWNGKQRFIRQGADEFEEWNISNDR
jgi:hypothetical protein